MYQFIINNEVVTRSEFFDAIDTYSRFTNEVYDFLSEVFETGSIDFDGIIFQIKEANI